MQVNASRSLPVELDRRRACSFAQTTEVVIHAGNRIGVESQVRKSGPGAPKFVVGPAYPGTWDSTNLNPASPIKSYFSALIVTAPEILMVTGPSNPEVINGELALNFVIFVCVNRFPSGKLWSPIIRFGQRFVT